MVPSQWGGPSQGLLSGPRLPRLPGCPGVGSGALEIQPTAGGSAVGAARPLAVEVPRQVCLVWAASINPRNSGWGFPGRDRNSGWYWQAVKKGWFFSSISSTNRPSGEVPLIT